VREGLEFDTEIESDTRNLNHIIHAMLDEFGTDIHLFRDPTRGGVATVLTEIARDTKLGIDIAQSKMPIDEQVYGACEILGLDPLYVANEGIFISVVDASIAEAYVHKLQSFEFCKNAAVIGEVETTHPGKVVLTSGIGGKRVVNMFVGEQLPRIC